MKKPETAERERRGSCSRAAPLFGVRMVWHALRPKAVLYALSIGRFSRVPRKKAARFSLRTAMRIARTAEAYESCIRSATGRKTRVEVFSMPGGKLVKRLTPNDQALPTWRGGKDSKCKVN